jgi:Domain of unknown function (DUF4340)
MRSISFTLLLLLLTALAVGLAAWQWTRGNFDRFIGAAPTPVGARIYTKFSAADVRSIHVSQNGIEAKFELTEKGWQATQPWRDRMDPRAAVAILNFTLGLRVEDFAKVEKIDAQKAGLKQSSVHVRLDGKSGQALAIYHLGRQTPWLATVEKIDQPVPTVFIQPRDDDHKNYIYSCTGDIGPLFKGELKYLRDHHPFYFNPLTLQSLHVVTSDSELTLARETPTSPWRITKPDNLATNPKAMKSLLEGLFEIRAVKLTDRASAKISPTANPAKASQISMTSFDSAGETTLSFSPPESADAITVRATVSGRPDTVLELPLKPEPELVSLADLPLTVNELRDASLTNLNIASLRSVRIQPKNGDEILISRTPPQPWMSRIDGESQEANEERLFALLKAVTAGRALAFKTDAATDFTPWGLAQPMLKLQFLGQDQQGLELNFGTDGKGNYYVNRTGTPTVMQVDPSLVAAIPTRAYEWRRSQVWSLDRNSLMQIERKTAADVPLVLRYDFAIDAWDASCGGKNLKVVLSPERANFMLTALEGLKVSRWLATDDEPADIALQTPSLTFRVTEKATNDMGDFTGLVTREVTLAPPPNATNPGFYYGRLTSETHPFLLDRETYQKLATELLEKE